jgi:xylulokinase
MSDAMLLGLDIGTGSAKALLLGEDGSVLAQGSAAYAVRSPHSGWAESDPSDWWAACGEAVRRAVRGHGRNVAALGLSGQMHGVVLTGADSTPVRPAILWADTRSGPQLELYRALDPDLGRGLANPYVTGMAGPSLLWVRDHEPEVYESARWALQAKDWVRLVLTGKAATEPSDASATLLYDLEADTWARPVVEALGLRSDLLPAIVPSAKTAGTLTKTAAGHLGLRPGLPVAAGAADAAAAALGSGLLLPGVVQLTVGTAGQIVAVRNSPVLDPTRRTHLYRTATPTHWYSMAAVQNVGLALEWVRAVLGVSWDQIYKEAFSVPAGAEGLTFLPYLTGERTPHMDPNTRGSWSGMGLHHSRAHLLRAALEGVAFALREALEALEATGLQVPELRLAGGGSAPQPWRSMLADILQRPLFALPESAASARGAALLAGVACGLYSSEADTLSLAPSAALVAAPGELAPQYDAAYDRYRELYPRLQGWPG